jgi:uncharacterized protein DUF6152
MRTRLRAALPVASARQARCAAFLVVTLLLSSALPLGAHHAFSAEFDVSKPMQLRGTLVKWEMINPHSWFHLEVKNPDGTLVTWMIEGGSPNQLIRMGVTKYTVKIGTELIVDTYLAKDGTNKAAGRNFVLPDGKRLFLGSQTTPGAGDTDPKK